VDADLLREPTCIFECPTQLSAWETTPLNVGDRFEES